VDSDVDISRGAKSELHFQDYTALTSLNRSQSDTSCAPRNHCSSQTNTADEFTLHLRSANLQQVSRVSGKEDYIVSLTKSSEKYIFE
jgi:hypothetical protein